MLFVFFLVLFYFNFIGSLDNALAEQRKGKIRNAVYATIHVKLQKILPYLLSQILQTRLLFTLDVVRCRHGNLLYKNYKYCFQ